MKRKKLIFISVILILCLMTSCSSINSTGEDKAAGKRCTGGRYRAAGGYAIPCFIRCDPGAGA